MWIRKVFPVNAATRPRRNGRPEALPESHLKRASICIDVDEGDRIDAAEAWIERNRAELTAAEETGCGCCVIGWDVEGPEAMIASIPDDWRAASAWEDVAPRADVTEGPCGLQSWWRRVFGPSA